LLDAPDEPRVRPRATGVKQRSRRRAPTARRSLPRNQRARVHGAVRPRPDLGPKARRRARQPPRCARPPAGPRPPPLPPARRRARLVLGCEIALHRGRAETRKRAGVTRGGRSAYGPRTDLPRVYRRVARAIGGRAESTRAG